MTLKSGEGSSLQHVLAAGLGVVHAHLMARSARHRRRASGRWLVGMIAAVLVSQLASPTRLVRAADAPGPVEAWRTSPYHGARNGDGQAIPCLCRHRGRSYNLGDKVCLQMPNGVMLARCDLFQNNTSWIPTEEACTLSWRLGPARASQSTAQSTARKS
jgi:hypothetical protein